MKNNRLHFNTLVGPATIFLAVVAIAGCTGTSARSNLVNIYSTRHYGAMEPMYAAFTEETGIEVRVSHGEMHALLERLKAEGERTVADAFFAVDAGGLWLAASQELLQPIESEVIRTNIPEELRDPENRFFALTQRVRSIAYMPSRVDPSELSTYEALADAKWRGRLCMRPATNVYTQSLVASIIAAHGEEQAEQIISGWAANNPEYIDSDTRILQTIAAGGCDVGITNHYYLARLVDQDADFPVKMFWANQDGRGVHRNVSGLGVTAAAANRDNAIRLIEWLSDRLGQAPDAVGLPGSNFEFPVNTTVDAHPIIAGFGSWRPDLLPLGEFGRYQADAIQLMERAGYR